MAGAVVYDRQGTVNDNSLIDDLLRHKLGVMDRRIEELEAAFQGNNLILNLCVAYSKKVEIENTKLKERIDSMMDAMVEHRDDIDATADSVHGLTKRIEGSAKWAATISEWAKEKGMK